MTNLRPAHAAPAASAATKPAEPSQKKQCFVISPIGPDDSDIRKRADQVLKHIIKKALSDNYAVERADDISKPGLITLQVIERLMKAPMVVADLTDANANVYYELAIRHFVKKPVVHLIAEGQQPPFDVAQMRYIPYDLTNPDSVEQAENDVRDHAAACEKGEVTFTPIQFVEMLDTARHDGENQFVSLALGIQSALSNLHSDVRQVRAQVSEELVFVYQRLLHELTENARRQAIDRPRGNLVSYRDLMIPPENVGSPPAQAKNAAFYGEEPKTGEPGLPPPPADSPKDKK